MIKQSLTSEYTFWEWQQQSDTYKNQFSLEGAKALFNYFDNLSDELGTDIEFDPIAWLCDFSEYDSVEEAYKEHYGDDSDLPVEQRRTSREQQLEYFEDNTQVIELDNGHVLIGAF